jgi:hypothetical protein
VGAAAGNPSQPGQHQHLLPQRLEALDDPAEREAPALRARRPFLHDHAVADVDGGKSAHRRGCAGECRNHAVQKRQRHAHPHRAQHRPAWESGLGDDHRVDLLI